jgi:hypothetical protein
MPPVELEPTTLAAERLQTYALDRAAAGISITRGRANDMLEMLSTNIPENSEQICNYCRYTTRE